MIRSFSRLSLLLLVPLAASLVLADDKKASTKIEMTKEEQALLKLLNEQRAKKDLPALKPHSLLIKAARAQAKNMAKQRKMEHDLDGKMLGQRVEAAGYNWGRVTENLAMAEDGEPPLSAIVKHWMESGEHRKNLLDKNVAETGVGIARNGNNEIYYTQIFARLRGIKSQK